MTFKSAVSDVYHDRTSFRIIQRSRTFAIISIVAVAVSLLALLVRDLNLNIDFEGGTAWQVKVASGDASAGEVRDVAEGAGIDQPTVKILGGGDELLVESREVDPILSREVAAALAAYAGVEESIVSVSEVGPTWGDEISRKAIQALLIFFAAVSIYLTLRFEWKMAAAALLALVHDLAITVGVYAILQFEVSPGTVVAVLTILGYSLYDTVVVFDKVRENTADIAIAKSTYSDTVNRSLNEVLLRSINTSLSALIPVLSLLVVGSFIFGALTIRDFGLALFVGLLSGTYSSIFVAAPALAWWKEREPASRRAAERAARAGAGSVSGQTAVVGVPVDLAKEARRTAPGTPGDGLMVPRQTVRRPDGTIAARPPRPRGRKRS